MMLYNYDLSLAKKCSRVGLIELCLIFSGIASLFDGRAHNFLRGTSAGSYVHNTTNYSQTIVNV